jgi:predicted transcriptional regulator
MPAKADTFSVRLPEDLKKKVDELARATRRSRSFIVQEAVESYVADRAAYMRELEEALISVDTEGAISGEAMFRWMRSLGTENELPPPEIDIPPRRKI